MTRVALLLLLLLSGSCQDKEAHSSLKGTATTAFHGNAMTIDYTIVIGKSLTSIENDEAAALIRGTFDEINRILNKWNPHSELSKLNALPAGVRVSISPQMQDFLDQTDQVVKLTDGLFDPTIEPLQKLWKQQLAKGKTPDNRTVESMLPAIGWEKIHASGGIFYKDRGETQLDLGGIAKGYCVDLLIERLNRAGYEHVLVEWGGEIRASGTHPDNRPWNIFISRLGDARPEHAIDQISLCNLAIATSGDYLQNWSIKETKNAEPTIYFHVINPRTGSPAIATHSSVASVSVMSPSCALADGIATALMLIPTAEEAEKFAQKMQEKAPIVSVWIRSRQQLRGNPQNSNPSN